MARRSVAQRRTRPGSSPRRRRRAPAGGARRYSLSYLLEHQPKTLRKHELYPLMLDHLRASDALQRLRVSRRCYSLLHNARIAPENLHHFYRTYRLPADPFFPLFFRIKRDYLAERERRREARHRSILESVRALPPEVLAFIKYLGRLEQRCHGRGAYPLWQEHLFPKSKKQAKAYSRYGFDQWLSVFRGHLDLLASRYPGLGPRFAEKITACWVLGLLPQPGGARDGAPGRWPNRPAETGVRWPAPPEVTAAYRRLSMQHHPDRGGDATVFVELKAARDVLESR
jgi:hypothetical protein